MRLRDPMSVARLRRSLGLTQEDLAERSGLSVRAIRKIEAGAILRPHRSTLGLLADGLELCGEQRRHFLDRSRIPDGEAEAALPVPHQLPPRVDRFLGRAGELAAVTEALSRPRCGPILITGMGGIGKTTLAVEACGRAELRTISGRLYLDLTAADGSRCDPAHLLLICLRAMSIRRCDIPEDLAERAALWRSAVAGQSVLLVLDNAVDEDQVRPVLLDGEQHRVVITSRGALGGLEAAVRIPLTPLDEQSAIDYLQVVSVPGAAALSASDASALAAACGRVPLALRLVAARRVVHHHLSPKQLLRRLATPDMLLDELSLGDRSMRHSLAGSVALLDRETRAALAATAQLQVPFFDIWLVEAVLDSTHASARDLLDELVAAGLLEPAGTTGYRHHDLVRAYARELTVDLDEQALPRLASWCVRLLTSPPVTHTRRPVPHVLWADLPDQGRDTVEEIDDLDDTSWFAGQWPCFVALTDSLAHAGQPRLAGAVLAALRPPMTRFGLLDELAELAQRCAAQAGGGGGDVLAHACAVLTRASCLSELGRQQQAADLLLPVMPVLNSADACTRAGAWYELGWCQHHLGQRAAAKTAYERAMKLHVLIGNRYGVLGCHVALADARLWQASRTPRRHAKHAMELAEAIDDPRALIKTLLAVGRLNLPNHPSDASFVLQRALAIAERTGETILAASCRTTLSAAHRRLGRDTACELAETAVSELRGAKREMNLADALTELGEVRHAGGATKAAVAAWQEALGMRLALGESPELRRIERLISAAEAGDPIGLRCALPSEPGG